MNLVEEQYLEFIMFHIENGIASLRSKLGKLAEASDEFMIRHIKKGKKNEQGIFGFGRQHDF